MDTGLIGLLSFAGGLCWGFAIGWVVAEDRMVRRYKELLEWMRHAFGKDIH